MSSKNSTPTKAAPSEKQKKESPAKKESGAAASPSAPPPPAIIEPAETVNTIVQSGHSLVLESKTLLKEIAVTEDAKKVRV